MELAKRRGAAALAAALAVALGGCSPVYLYKSAAGHIGLLARRRPIDRVLADPREPESLKERLRLVLDARAFAFERLGLERSRDYSSYARVPGPALTYLVTAARPLELKPYAWRFPLIGTFPYKGYFDRRDAESEATRMRRRGFDVYVGGSGAYNTPLWLADPLPATALASSTGSLSALIIHELTHGTLFFRRDVAFSESLATFVGERGAVEFLALRFGPQSAERAAYLRELDNDRRFAARIDELYDQLDALYGSPADEQEKLRRREDIFTRARPELERLGWSSPALNNAAVLAVRVYRSDQGLFDEALARAGGDWRAFFRLLSGLDRARPAADLRERLGSGR